MTLADFFEKRGVSLRRHDRARCQNVRLGTYQADLLTGRASWSGSDLRGAAAQYGGQYARRRVVLLARVIAVLAPLGLTAHVSGCTIAIVRESVPDLVVERRARKIAVTPGHRALVRVLGRAV